MRNATQEEQRAMEENRTEDFNFLIWFWHRLCCRRLQMSANSRQLHVWARLQRKRMSSMEESNIFSPCKG